MIERTLSCKLISLARHFPVVFITGPRQSGKTILAQAVFRDHQYISLEDPNEHEAALADPKEFLRRFAGGVAVLANLPRPKACWSMAETRHINGAGSGYALGIYNQPLIAAEIHVLGESCLKGFNSPQCAAGVVHFVILQETHFQVTSR